MRGGAKIAPLEFERRKQEHRQQANLESGEVPENSTVIQPMTEEEKTAMLRELLLPKDEQDFPPQNGGS